MTFSRRLSSKSCLHLYPHFEQPLPSSEPTRHPAIAAGHPEKPQMNAVTAETVLPGLRGQGPPDLFGRKAQHRRHQLRHGNDDLEEHRLRSAPQGRIRPERIEPILENIEIDGTQIHRAEVVERMEDRVKLKLVIGCPEPAESVR